MDSKTTLFGMSPGNRGKRFQRQEDGLWYWIKMGKPTGKGYTDNQMKHDFDHNHVRALGDE